ncbi:MAG: DUF177 domain-containing protein [Alphaproteobacteria bacterium]|nr:DUF177 domain-containing protein [Alphaproteobacteria bacterium]
MPNKAQLMEQEWSHFFDVEELEKKPLKIQLQASPEECADLSKRFGVEEVKSASADLTVTRQGGHIIYVSGTFESMIVQNCVITLEPVETALSDQVEGWFADKEATVSFAAAKRDRDVVQQKGEVEILDEKDDPEAIIDGQIDLGELVTQHISLTIPAYPRKEGAEYEQGDAGLTVDENSPLRKNPFEALKSWKEER